MNVDPSRTRKFVVLLAVLSAMLVAGCGDGGTQSQGIPQAGTEFTAPDLPLGFPQSLTGAAAAGQGLAAPAGSGSSVPFSGGGETFCHFDGQDDADAFRNGYRLTRWLVAHVAGWLCFTNEISHAVAFLAHVGAIPVDGTYVPIDDGASPDDPTGLRVLKEDGQKSVWLYFRGNAEPGLYLSWMGGGGTVSGRMILLTALIQQDPIENLALDAEAPTHARMDFTYGGGEKRVQMAMAFDPYDEFGPLSWHNPWATGFRVDAVKTVADGSFDITGLIVTHGQWDPLYPGDGTPLLKLAAVSDAAGTGASVARIEDLGVGLHIDANDTIGYFRMDKDDRYYFQFDGSAEWIEKRVTAADYWPGSESYTDLDDAWVDTALGLDNVTGLCTNDPSDSAACVTLLNAVFDLGVWGADWNSGTTEPNDARKAALDSAVYPAYATPDAYAGDWTGVFDMSFTP